MREEWRDVKGYEGKYMVSNCGRVKTLERTYGRLKNGHERRQLETVMRLAENWTGHLYVWLYKGEGKKKHYVHRLVAVAFIPNPDSLPVVDHVDEDKRNNLPENLRWCTQADNIRFRYGKKT